MAKNLLVIGIGKPPQMPPRYGAKKPQGTSTFGQESPAERDASEYKSAPPAAPAEESPEFEQETHNLPLGGKFPPENVHYHTAADECQGCHHWDASTSSCKVVAMATDPGGWCSLFPGEYAEHELTEQPGVEEEEPGVEGSEGMAA